MKREMGVRPAIYAVGVVILSVGVVLCRQSDLGISPPSTIPYVLEIVTGISFGNLTMMFHLVNIAAQMILRRKVLDAKLLLQIPFAVVLGQLINIIQPLIQIDSGSWALRIAALAGGVFITALGMVCILRMNLVANPPDGTVQAIEDRFHVEFTVVKNIYDISLVVIAAVMGWLLLGRLAGIGIGTLVSALGVGRCVALINRVLAMVTEGNVRKPATDGNGKESVRTEAGRSR